MLTLEEARNHKHLAWRRERLFRCAGNVCTLVAHSCLSRVLSHDVARGRVVVTGPLPWDNAAANTDWLPTDDAACAKWLASHYPWNPSPATVRRGIRLFARTRGASSHA